MSGSKFGKFIVLGAVTGAVVSLFDRQTREQVMETSKKTIDGVRYYSKHPEVIKEKIQEKSNQVQSIYQQVTGDASYIKKQVEELRILTPQVKNLVVNTKDAILDSKDEVKAIVNEPDEVDVEPIKKQ